MEKMPALNAGGEVDMTLEAAALDWAVPALLSLLCFVSLYLYGTWNHSTWRSQGIPGPKPSPFLGNAKEMQEKGSIKALREWNKKYGKIYGIHLFHRPMLVADDIDILKEVFIKDFNNFINRGLLLPLMRPETSIMVLNSSGDMWRRQRHTLTPTFSASKLKQMGRFINRCCDNLVDSIIKTSQNGKPLDVKRTFGCYTIDVIAGTGFSLETNTLEDDSNAFLNAAVRMFADFTRSEPLAPVALAFLCPCLEPILKLLGFTNTAVAQDSDFMMQLIRDIIADRKHTGREHVDLLQLMLDAESTEEHVRQHPGDKSLTVNEIIAQAVLLFVAGYETTATLLQYMSYCLAMHPDVQEKLHDEIVDALGEAAPSYETISRISYLDCCVLETLRMFPPVPLFGRVSKEARTIKGVTIGANETVICSVSTLTMDEDFYPEPEKFDPSRFEEGGCSSHVPTMIKELPFGCGPRQCIGMRLALYEAKMAMAALVRKVRFLRIPETPEKITFKNTRLSTPVKPILVGVQLRS